ncbi:Syntaxin-8 [Orchesella cincta]|uniref:Syntaxin-8 n=1 Tax=Orchesella cincta TaxID=48709 RepID=A0A1D2M3P2_ORCCI|nr:Syntaxin-8 [Orchesella cincta]
MRSLTSGGYAPLGNQPKVVSWDDDDDEDEEVQFSGRGSSDQHASVQQIRQQQAEMLQEQDRGLEALSEVISRQKNLAQVIGNEVEYQNELIDDITDHVDRTNDRLIAQTSRVRTIDRKDATGRYWAVIILLLVVIIIIVVV